ncbi:MAG: mechanosensitive ion channel family protein [SAR324 cluster bacterium]|nr:mechanosensitive ion channel family protein [SAR324 cluster bacterium]
MQHWVSLDWIKDSTPAWELMYATIFSLILLAAGIVLLKFFRKGMNSLEKQKLLTALVNQILQRVGKWLIILIFMLLILQQYGVSIVSIWTVISAVLAMVAVGFVAVWSVLSNVLCTFILLVVKPFRIGDEIEVIEPSSTNAGIRGKVVDLNLIYTTLEHQQQDEEPSLVIIPNNIFFQKGIRRKSGKVTVSLETQMMVNKVARTQNITDN